MIEDDDDELKDLLLQMTKDEQEINQLSTHIDVLFSWYDFLNFKLDNILKFEKNLLEIKEAAKKIQESEVKERQFLIGVLWIGTISAYEGAMHSLFLASLQVEELQQRIRSFCEIRIKENKPPHKGMKEADAISIGNWFRNCAITNPMTAAKRFDEVYGITTVYPDPMWCKNILDIRNIFAHRNGEGLVVSGAHLLKTVEMIEQLGVQFHEVFLKKCDEIISIEP
jgi:hypothetical protein